MEILTANTGSYPRVGEESDQLKLRKAYNKWKKDQISAKEMEEHYEEYTREVIAEQERAGLNVVTDGLLRWYDPISHFTKDIDGCEINGLLRFFDTNFYIRQPVITDKIEAEQSVVNQEFSKARKVAEKKVKPVITGPYTLSKYSINNFYGDFSRLVQDFTEVIKKEISDLVENGAEEIQIDEPAILQNRENFGIFAKAIEKLAEVSGDSQLDLYVYFGDAVPVYERLQELPVDLLGLDFTYSSKLLNLIRREKSTKALGLGMIDARNTKMERPAEIIQMIEKIAPNVHSEKMYLNPSCGIEFLPRKRAFEKLKNMVEIAQKVEERIK